MVTPAASGTVHGLPFAKRGEIAASDDTGAPISIPSSTLREPGFFRTKSVVGICGSGAVLTGFDIVFSVADEGSKSGALGDAFEGERSGWSSVQPHTAKHEKPKRIVRIGKRRRTAVSTLTVLQGADTPETPLRLDDAKLLAPQGKPNIQSLAVLA